MIHIGMIDYGAGNLHSLKKGLEAGGAQVTITTDWEEALARDALVLPGVGSFGAAVAGLQGRADRVREVLEGGYPALGICLGMQLLFPTSEEAPGEGIGLIPGRVRRIRAPIVPQIGWNDVEAGGDPLFQGVGPFPAYYANSYVCDPEESADGVEPIAFTDYAGDRFVAGIRRGRSWGLQFHPEKSSGPGLAILANFVRELER